MVKRLTNPLQELDLPLGSLMSAAGARLAAILDATLREAGFADLRAAHAGPFMVLDAEGTRPSELAARAHMTKQAMGELVSYLVDHGYLEVLPDPDDRRARLVRPTARGWRAVDTGLEAITAFDRWLEEQLGAKEVAHLRRNLRLILEAPMPGQHPLSRR
jgi:DNA-binding MarR family transcriptional regulator